MKKVLEKLRSVTFWMTDSLRGGQIKGHVNDIKSILENYGSKESRDKIASNISNLLNHATETTSFYKDLKGFKSLSDFPVINKITIRENFEGLQSAKFKDKSNHMMQTSGSSGMTTTTLQDENKRRRNTADTIYFKGRAGFKVGHRLYYIRKWFKMHTKSSLVTWFRNIIMVDVTSFSDEYLSDFINSLKKDNSTKILLGYSSAYRDICKYLDKINSAPIESDITCIIAMSEALSDHTRQSLEKYFKAPVISRYSNLENGIFSMQFPNHGTNFHINWASYYIELLHPEHDTPVDYGVLGRVVITDLFNYCMPIIRYDTGDLAIMTGEENSFNKAPSFTKVEGRKMDILFDTQGRTLSPYIVFHMESFPEIKQFQIIQESEKTYLLKLNTDQEFKVEQELISIYRDYFGDDANIRIEYVNEIPQLSSGKRRLTVNNYLLEKEAALTENI
jgi:phenylacetate-CoA ligase